jgi:aldehyde:ferredoxin oxidoreductase
MKAGPHKGLQVDLEAMRRNYWQAIGWDAETGIPQAETLDALGLPGLQEGEGATL